MKGVIWLYLVAISLNSDLGWCQETVANNKAMVTFKANEIVLDQPEEKLSDLITLGAVTVVPTMFGLFLYNLPGSLWVTLILFGGIPLMAFAFGSMPWILI